MTEFTQTLRHRCRNPRCRSKLPVLVSNDREAFCTKGCHSSFYLHRCLVCERPIEQPKRGRRFICKKATCRTDWKAGFGFGRYVASPHAKITQEKPDFVDSKSPIKPDRAWRIVAGEISPSALHCAVVGAGEAVEASNRTNARHWREANARAEATCLIKRDDSPVNIVGGYKFPGAPAIDLNPRAARHDYTIEEQTRLAGLLKEIPADLSIPEFLRR